jgi:hypothetical protein
MSMYVFSALTEKPQPQLFGATSSLPTSPECPGTSATRLALPPSNLDDDHDEDVELLSERVRRIELDALSHLGDLGESSGGRFKNKFVRLKDEHHSQAGLSTASENIGENQSGREFDFVSKLVSI